MFHVDQNYEINQYRIENIQREVQNDRLAQTLSDGQQRMSVIQYVVNFVRRFQPQAQRPVAVRQLKKA
jgi:hypothetical protein